MAIHLCFVENYNRFSCFDLDTDLIWPWPWAPLLASFFFLPPPKQPGVSANKTWNFNIAKAKCFLKNQFHSFHYSYSDFSAILYPLYSIYVQTLFIITRNVTFKSLWLSRRVFVTHCQCFSMCSGDVFTNNYSYYNSQFSPKYIFTTKHQIYIPNIVLYPCVIMAPDCVTWYLKSDEIVLPYKKNN